MIKKILIAAFIFAAALVFAVNIFAKKAPDLLRESLQKSLNKKVNIGSIRYDFPGTFFLESFEIEEDKPFEGEISFYADRILLQVSPMSLSRRALVIDRIDVENAKVFMRHLDGRLTHALSKVVQKTQASSRPGSSDGQKSSVGDGLPLEIKQFHLADSQFKYVDFDLQKGGFVIAFDQIQADLGNIRLPESRTPTSYRIQARLLQGRDQRPAMLRLEGVTRFGDYNTDARWDIQGVHLPYFQPYYAIVTPALIEEGLLDSHARVRVEHKDLSADIGLEIRELAFGNYEEGNELFGLKADEILTFLKDSSGKLKFQVSVNWNLTDRSVRLHEVIRRSIERSLKQTVLGNVGKILKTAIRHVSEEGVEKTKEDLEARIKKLKKEWINF